MTDRKNNKGSVFLIPTIIAENTIHKAIPLQVKEVTNNLRYFLVENIRSARRYLSALKIDNPIDTLFFEELNKKTDDEKIRQLLKPALEGEDVGIISEAGCPGIADPGARAVKYAHEQHLKVIPLVGPSSILMALMASGFNGQSFVFHGYLPIDKHERIKKIKLMEKNALTNKQTQIFMETPYRNDKLFHDITNNCRPYTKLCIAKNITGPDEQIITLPVELWKKQKINLHKIPSVFLLYQ